MLGAFRLLSGPRTGNSGISPLLRIKMPEIATPRGRKKVFPKLGENVAGSPHRFASTLWSRTRNRPRAPAGRMMAKGTYHFISPRRPFLLFQTRRAEARTAGVIAPPSGAGERPRLHRSSMSIERPSVGQSLWICDFTATCNSRSWFRRISICHFR
jgi:hypothetical protein